MKKSKLSFLLLVVILALTFISCGPDKDTPNVTENQGTTEKPHSTESPSTTEEPPSTESPDIAEEPTEAEEAIEKALLENWREYTFTYEHAASNVIMNALGELSSAMMEKCQFIFRPKTDFVLAGEEPPNDTLEILIGDTNRQESIKAKEGLRANDYFIGMENNRIVIVGGSDRATALAIEHFASSFVDFDGIYYPTESYTYKGKYKVDTLTLGGVDISEFAIVRKREISSLEAGMIKSLRDLISDICGVNLEIKTDASEEQTYEILIGNTGRAITSKEMENGTYAIEQTDTKLALFGNGENSSVFVLARFINALLEIPSCESYDIKLDCVFGEPYTKLSLVENNLPTEFSDLRGKYDYSVLSAETTQERFLATVEELPNEVTVLDPINLEDYPLLNSKKQVYVSTSGSDSNAGTKESPYKSIARALKDMKNQGGGVIWVEGGRYSLDSGIVIDAPHSGTAISPLFIKSYGDEDVTLTSNVIVDSANFKPVDVKNDEVAARLKDGLEGKVYYVNLYDLGWTEDDIVPITKENGPARMYVDGEEFTLAQFPNAFYEDGTTRTEIHDLLYFKYVYDSGSVTSRDGSNLYWPWIERTEKDPILEPNSIWGWEIRVLNARDRLADKGDEAMGDEILSWVNTGDIWYYGSVFEGWEHGYYTIDPACVHSGNLLGTFRRDGYYSLKSVQPCSYGAKTSGNSAAGRNTFVLFNAIEALDAPGEWFIDRESGNLYIYPKSDDITKQEIAYSGSNAFNLISVQGASYVVLDGIGADCTSGSAIYVNHSDNVIIQNAKIRNTKESSVWFVDSKESALLYSDISYSYEYMVSVSHSGSVSSLDPIDIFIQNNTFSDTPSTVSYAVSAGGCRTIVSHNHFIDCCLNGSGVEHIIEYNKFEGGNKFVTDGGMIYFGSYNKRGIHIRYNLLHMFKATHNAIYFDTMGSGMYAYGNVISTLGGQSNIHKSWYSSTGHGNVCYANIMVLRNKSQIDALAGKDTDEGTEAINKGDTINESGLFYYYYGNNEKGNSLAGHWWMGLKENEVNARLKNSDQEAWNARYPEYMNFLEGTKCINEAYKYPDYKVYYTPQKLSSRTHVFKTEEDTVIWVPPYEYLDENGSVQTKEEQILKAQNGQILLTFDDIAAMERLRRQAAFSVIKNNLILGGSSNPDNVITNGAESYKALLKGVTLKDGNYFEFYYDKIMADAENYDYTISDDAWDMIKSEMGVDFVNLLKPLDYKKAGLTR